VPRWLRWTFGIVGLAVVAAGLAFALLTAADRAFHAKVAELRADGFATTTAEFLGPAPPGSEVAGAELQAAWNAVGAGPGDPRGRTVDPGMNWPDQMFLYDPSPWYESDEPARAQELEVWLEASRPFYERVSAVVARPTIRFRRKVDAYGMPDAWTEWRLIEDVAEALEARARAAPDPADRVAACRRSEASSRGTV